MRYPVEIIWELLRVGMAFEEILTDDEDLERGDIYAALAFATRMTQVKRMHASGNSSIELCSEFTRLNHYIIKFN